jgi:LPS export ABC transporter protein LptC
LYGQKNKIELSHGVDMHELVANGGRQLLTQGLTIYPDQKLIETTLPVTGLQPGLKINAVGARYDQKADVVYLLSQVTAQYQPTAGNEVNA